MSDRSELMTINIITENIAVPFTRLISLSKAMELSALKTFLGSERWEQYWIKIGRAYCTESRSEGTDSLFHLFTCIAILVAYNATQQEEIFHTHKADFWQDSI